MSNTAFDLSNPHIKSYINKMTNPFLQRIFLLAKLPSALFMGLKIQHIDLDKAQVSVPYGWRSQNPFKSIYFAAQAAAAEMSTGVLCLMALQGRGNVSVLVADIKGDFIKKATSKTVFTCTEAEKVFETVRKAIETGEAQTVTLHTEGVQKTGEVVSRFEFTWTFKARK